MAVLQNTTINGNLAITSSMSAPTVIVSNTNTAERVNATPLFIYSSINSATNYVYLFTNNAGYGRMYGELRWWVTQSQYHSGCFKFQLSRYGFNYYTVHSTAGYWNVELYQDPGNPDINSLKFSNTIGTVWGDGTYYFSLRYNGGSFSSSYLTTRTR